MKERHSDMPSQLDRVEWKIDVLLALMQQGIKEGGLVIPPLPVGVTRAEAVEPEPEPELGVRPRSRVELDLPRMRQEVEAGSAFKRDPGVMHALSTMSVKQHAVSQMIIRGASNQEIARRFGVSDNTAKVYLRSLAKKLGVRMRTQIAFKLLPVLQDMGAREYKNIAKGLPKDWDETYDYERREDDPYWHAYTGVRVGRRGLEEDRDLLENDVTDEE